MSFENVIVAFALTLFAGLATGIGSTIALLTRKTNTRFLSIALGFSAGVMIYVSFAEILVDARETLVSDQGQVAGNWILMAAFFGGIILIGLIDKLVPAAENPHEIRKVEESQNCKAKDRKLMRMGILAALAIAIHNFPEGIATFATAVENPGLGIAIAIAIAIHNIPEGIAISIPVYYATGDRWKAFRYSFLSGLAEPLGAVVAYVVLLPFLTPMLMGIIFAAVAGIMVYISLDELLPAAKEYGEHHLSIYGLVLGMAVMAISLNLFIPH